MASMAAWRHPWKQNLLRVGQVVGGLAQPYPYPYPYLPTPMTRKNLPYPCYTLLPLRIMITDELSREMGDLVLTILVTSAMEPNLVGNFNKSI